MPTAAPSATPVWWRIPRTAQQGWHIIYLEGWDEPVWKLTGKNALTNEKLNTWLEGLTENMEATHGAGVKYLGE